MGNAIDLDSQAALGLDKLEMIRTQLAEVTQFVQQVYFVDVCAVAAMYPDWFKIGSGVKNYLAVPDLPLDRRGSAYDLPGGHIHNVDLSSVKGFQTASDPAFRQSGTEDVMHAYYQGEKPPQPWVGETEPAFTGTVGANCEPGQPLSAPVRQAVAPAIEPVVQELRRLRYPFRKKPCTNAPVIEWDDTRNESSVESRVIAWSLL